MPAHAFGGQLDRRQRVLDLVREAPRDFAPGGHLLRPDERRHVVEHDDDAVGAAIVAAQRRRHDREMQLAAAARQRHVARADVAAASQCFVDDVSQRLQVAVAEGLARRKPGDRRVDAKQPRGGGIRGADAAERIDGDDAGGNAIENRFDVRFRPSTSRCFAFELVSRSLETPAVGGQLARHAVERLDERAEFILRFGHHAMIEVAGADLPGRCRQGAESAA